VILNRLEKALMNNAIRAACQRYVEARQLLALGGPVPGGVALELGCGRGVGVEIILTRFGATRVDAIDLDPDMVAQARERLARYGSRVRLFTGRAERLAAADATYDAVFDFGIIHHVPDWRRAVREAARVLKPRGRFYVEEVYRPFLASLPVRLLTRHPRDDRFDAAGFAAEVERQGLRIRGRREVAGLGGWLVAEKPVWR
jgi:ubiquinone/menaquinone biosynthesis C-methylase UbiE